MAMHAGVVICMHAQQRASRRGGGKHRVTGSLRRNPSRVKASPTVPCLYLGITLICAPVARKCCRSIRLRRLLPLVVHVEFGSAAAGAERQHACCGRPPSWAAPQRSAGATCIPARAFQGPPRVCRWRPSAQALAAEYHGAGCRGRAGGGWTRWRCRWGVCSYGMPVKGTLIVLCCSLATPDICGTSWCWLGRISHHMPRTAQRVHASGRPTGHAAAGGRSSSTHTQQAPADAAP